VSFIITNAYARLAPIVLFVYARPLHTEQTIEALAKNKLAKESKLYIFADAAKHQGKEADVHAVRQYIESIEERQWFAEVTIIKSSTNKGLANSVISGVTQIINVYGQAIVVEDDLVTSPDFLLYMNQALAYYRSNKTIWSISGYSPKIAIPKEVTSDIYIVRRGCSWGWGTWKDRWEMTDWLAQDYRKFKYNPFRRVGLNRGGADMASMLDDQMRGKIDSWAIRWCYSQYKHDMYTVYPVQSRLKNIGVDGSGTHQGVGHVFDTDIYDTEIPIHFEHVHLNKKIVKEFRKKFDSRLGVLMKAAVRKINKVFIRGDGIV